MTCSRPVSVMLWLCAMLMAIPAPAQQPPGSASSTAPTPAPLATNLQLTLGAWNAFRAGSNEEAIAKADQCIREFRDAADRMEAELGAAKATLPKGKASPADLDLVGQYEELHDVAQCFLIKGMAEEKIGNREAARAAYAKAGNYTHARIHDPATDSFRSPADKAAERLAHLKDALKK